MMTQEQIDAVVNAITAAWDSSECERDPCAVFNKVVAAVKGLAGNKPACAEGVDRDACD